MATNFTGEYYLEINGYVKVYYLSVDVHIYYSLQFYFVLICTPVTKDPSVMIFTFFWDISQNIVDTFLIFCQWGREYEVCVHQITSHAN